MDGAFSGAALAQIEARHFDIEVVSSPRRAPVRPLIDIVKAFATASTKGEAVWRQGDLMLEVAGARFNKAETRAIVLLHFKQGEQHSVSAHLVIDLSAAGGNIYPAILEIAPGFKKPVLEHALSALAQRWCNFYAMSAGGKFGEVRPQLRFVEAPDEVVSLTITRALALCEMQIVPDISAKLDAALKLRAVKRAA